MADKNVVVAIVDEKIDMSPYDEFLVDPDVGSHGWFHGVTRRKTTRGEETKVTAKLSYDAHRPMALRELQSLADETKNRFGLVALVAVHRLGEVPIGEASIVVGCSSAHREPTFEALRWFMIQLKRNVPIWKKETYEDGSTEWVHPTQPTEDQTEPDVNE